MAPRPAAPPPIEAVQTSGRALLEDEDPSAARDRKVAPSVFNHA